MNMIEEPIEQTKIITKQELRTSSFEALWQDDPEGWWERCPPCIMVTVNYTDMYVRYCFDYPTFDYHKNDYYEYGPQAVEVARKYFKEG